MRNGTSMSHTTQGVPRGQRSKTSSVVVNLTATAAPAGQGPRSDTAQAVLPARLHAPDTDKSRTLGILVQEAGRNNPPP